jgi:hypothetical protein
MQQHHAMSLWAFLPPYCQAAWEAAAQAVLDADSDGRHTTMALFRYGIGDTLRFTGAPSPLTVYLRRWVERHMMPPYAEYGVGAVEAAGVRWVVEADLDPWEDRP